MKVKKLFALVLAVAMVFALAIPAFADEAGTYGSIVQCPRCGGQATVETRTRTERVSVSYCSKYNFPHAHTVTTKYSAYSCQGCGYWEDVINTTSTCLYKA